MHCVFPKERAKEDIYAMYSKLNTLISRRHGNPNNDISLYWKSSLGLFESTKYSNV